MFIYKIHKIVILFYCMNSKFSGSLFKLFKKCLLHRYFQNPQFLESVGAGTTVRAKVNVAQLIYQNSNTAPCICCSTVWPADSSISSVIHKVNISRLNI